MARKWTAAQKKEASERMKKRWRSGKMGKKKKGAHKKASKSRRPKKTKAKKAKKGHRAQQAHYQNIGMAIAASQKKKSRKKGRPKVLGYVGVTTKDIAAAKRLASRFGGQSLKRLIKHAPKR